MGAKGLECRRLSALALGGVSKGDFGTKRIAHAACKEGGARERRAARGLAGQVAAKRRINGAKGRVTALERIDLELPTAMRMALPANFGIVAARGCYANARVARRATPA